MRVVWKIVGMRANNVNSGQFSVYGNATTQLYEDGKATLSLSLVSMMVHGVPNR